MRWTAVLALLVAVPLLAGCADEAPADPVGPVPEPAADARVLTPLLANATGLEPPAFRPGTPVGTGFNGEPTLVSAADGRLFVTFPGCYEGAECPNGPLFESQDEGSTWKRLGLANGSLSPDGPDANGDAMLAIGADGALYASNLGGGIPVWASHDAGTTWTYVDDVVPATDAADRQWGWAGPPGMVVQAWMSTAPTRSAAVAVSWEHGRNFTRPTYVDDNIGWIGPIAGTPDGQTLLVPYTLPVGTVDPLVSLMVVPDVELKVLRSTDGGRSWQGAPTGVTLVRNPAGLQWSGTLMAPAMAITGSGTFVYAWSEENLDPVTRATGTVAVVKAMLSRDGGASWSEPRVVSGARTAIMPWVVGGAGERFAVAMYASSDVRADNDYEGTWDVDLVVVDGEANVAATVASRVHEGGICARGGMCFASASDRSMLDFLGAAALPDGRVAVAYAASPGGPGAVALGTDTTILVAAQEGGARLW